MNDNTRLLKDLLENMDYKSRGPLDISIKGIAYDSRNVEPGFMFVALVGFNSNGHDYIEKALKAGAAALVVSQPLTSPAAGTNPSAAGTTTAAGTNPSAAGSNPATDTAPTIITVPDTRKALALISAAWFSHPAGELTVIGITGTKGKTTTTHMVKSIMEAAGQKTGMIGTLGAFIGGERIVTKNTTPESFELHSLFRQMVKEGCTHVVMEVSSQAMKLERTYGIRFDIGAFLNLSEDHIAPGEHESFEEYRHFKEQVFTDCERAVFNLDGDFGEAFRDKAKEYIKEENIFTVSRKGEASLMSDNICNFNENGILGTAADIKGLIQGTIKIPMPGSFNLENALVSCGICALLGVDAKALKEGLMNVTVKGRTQLIREVTARTGAVFIIDYAHNALSTEALLTLLRGYSPKRLICLFGGGGNRPKKRRYDMGEISAKYADLIILAEDNPRFEAIADINRDIIEGIDVHNGKYLVIDDRKEAIEYLLKNTGEGDICALIGKGHETYQDVRGEKHYFCEEEIILDWVNNTFGK